MRAYTPIFAFLLAVLSLTACQERYNATEEWRRENEKAFEDFASDDEYTAVSVDGSTAFVYMKHLKQGTGTIHPIETSRVQIHYSCSYLAGNQAEIDSNFDSEKPATMALNRGGNNDCILGVRIALQNMVVGDETEVIIPWYLAYGSTSNSSVRGYSALRYHLQLDSIIPEYIP